MSKDEWEEGQEASDFGTSPKSTMTFEPADHEQAIRILSLDYALNVFEHDTKQRTLPEIAQEIERYINSGATGGLRVVK